jgi:cytochrome c oxidase cbb3-type subunit 3
MPEGFSTALILGGFLTVLILANALMANVLFQLARAHQDRENKKRSIKATTVATVLLLAMLILPNPGWAQEAASAATDAVAAATPKAPSVILGLPAIQFYVVISLICFFTVTLLFLTMQVRAFGKMLRDQPQKAVATFNWKRFTFFLNRSVSVSDEASIELEHDYDGIRELDNDLPPWWKWGFVLTVIVSVLYIGYYHFGDGPSQKQEYEIAVKEAEAAKAANLAKAGAQVDENTVELTTDAAVLADAKALFNNTCAACHRPDGGGAVGPNLTDDYWLHGGSVHDVFKSIKYGWRDKGMPPWGGNLSPKQISGITSYIKSLHGTKPTGGKDPQGTLYEEKTAAAPEATATNAKPEAEKTKQL